MRGDERICYLCKREGTNGFHYAPVGGHEGLYTCHCTNSHACRKRRLTIRPAA